MDNALHITSIHNHRIKGLERLRRKQERNRLKLMLIEGTREITRAFEAGVVIDECFLDSDAEISGELERLVARMRNQGTIPISVASRIYKRIAYREGSSGILAVGRIPDRLLEDLPVGKDALYIVMDTLEKPGNLGAVLRSADGAGVTGVISSDERTDLYNPNVIRASLGTVFTLPAVTSTSAGAIEWLKANEIQIVVTTPSAGLLYTEADLTVPTAIVVGSEDRGASGMWLEAAHFEVRIPMMGSADSLNVAQSATILVYEALRQRSSVGGT